MATLVKISAPLAVSCPGCTSLTINTAGLCVIQGGWSPYQRNQIVKLGLGIFTYNAMESCVVFRGVA